MYIGSTGERGLHHLIWEVVDNSVDEAMAGHADQGRGHAAGRRRDPGRGRRARHPGRACTRWRRSPTVEVVLTSLHAGGKFDDKSYAVSGGLHGVGVSVVNALSTALDVEIHRDGKIWRQHYDYAKPGELVEGGPTKKTGTTITYWADPKIFEIDRRTRSRRSAAGCRRWRSSTRA